MTGLVEAEFRKLHSRLKGGVRALLAAALVMPALGCVAAAAQDPKDEPAAVYGPRICVDARFWNTPGWRPRGGDYAYIKMTTGRTTLAEVRKALENIPAAGRMLRSSSMAGLESVLHQLIEVEGFKLGSLGLELGDSPAPVPGGQALAHKFGLKFFAFTARKSAERFDEQTARAVDLLAIDGTAAAVDDDTKLYRKLLAANRSGVIFQSITATAEGNAPQQRALRYYRANADLVQGLLVNANSPGQAGALLRAIRPELGRDYAVAPDEGPSMYFFTFHWRTPGWQPRAGDYATAKIRPQLKTFEEKVAYVLQDLKDVAPENRMVQFNSLSGAAELLKEVIETRHFPIACLGYDLEDWELTAGQEKSDPVGACKYGQSLAKKYGLDFIVTPDMPMSRKWGARIAPYINAIKPQCKGLQAQDIDKAIAYQRALSIEVRRANPDVRVLHDVGISPKGVLQTPQGLLRYYAGVADVVDGIGVFSVNTPEQNAVVEKYIIGVRPPLADRRAK